MPSFLLPTSGSTLTACSIGHCDVRSRLCQQLTLEVLRQPLCTNIFMTPL
jgi:hypothetical protein